MESTFNSWEDLKLEILSLFTTHLEPEALSNILCIIEELENNTEKYINQPRDFKSFLNEDLLAGMGTWMSYLSGGMAYLLEIKFYDKERREITSKEEIRQCLSSSDPEIMNNTFFEITPVVDTLKKFNSKKVTFKPK